MTDDQFMAGAASVDITPDLNAYDIHLHGYGARGVKIAEGVHDPLHGKVLALQQGGKRAVIITIDNLQFDGLLVEAVAARAATPGITSEAIAMCASHTHSAPAALQKQTQDIPSRRMSWYQPNYYDYCVDQLAQGINDAFDRLQPARCWTGKARLGAMIRNRRVPSYDYGTRGFSGPVEKDVPVDDEMVAIQIVGESNDVIATLVNIAAHATIMGADNMLVSADWPGVMQREIEASHGGVCLYSNGAEGNVAPDCGPGPLGFDDVESFGRAIASRADDLLKAATYRAPGAFDVCSTMIDLPDYQIAEQSPYLQAGLDRDFVDTVIHAIYPRRVQQTVIRLDEAAMLTIPGEMFTELSLDFKARARQMGIATPVILGLGNGSIGYMPSPDQYAKPGYETGMCLYGPGLGTSLIDAGLKNLAGIQSSAG